MYRKRDFKEQSLISSVQGTMKVMCKCGRKNSFYVFEKDIKLCDWCKKRYVFRNKRVEFEYRLKEKLIRQKRGELII